VRVECESCRELVVASFAIDGATVHALCPVCRHVTSAASAPGAPADAWPAHDPVAPGAAADHAAAAAACPKCGAARPGDAAACRSCGLTVAREAAYLAARDAAVPEPVRDAWTRAAAAWHDDAGHDALLRLVAANDAYAWAAGRYRTRGRDPVAVRQLDRLRRAAEATLFAGATARPAAASAPYRATTAVLAMLVIAVAAGFLYMFVVRDHAGARARPADAAGPAGAAGPVRPLVPGHPVSSSTIEVR
jgi:ribosomal protein L40E